MNLIQFNAAIDSHMVGWAPAPVFRDNQLSATRNLNEFIRLTVLQGIGSLDETTGIYSVNGSVVLHSFLLVFDVFTAINTNTDRSDELCQSVMDHWQVLNLGDSLHLGAATVLTIGEEPPRYHAAVQISGTREERLTTRA